MLNFFPIKSAWEPPEPSILELENGLLEIPKSYDDYLIIFQIEPYIDSMYVHFDHVLKKAMYTKRFVFKDEYVWDYEDERIFIDRCLNNQRCGYSYAQIDSIYKIYSKKYPDFKLSRYYTEPFKLLDHIYHCMRKGSAKEMLYKAGLDELAAGIDALDEINLMASRPSELYDGISIRTLRALNCKAGASLLGTKYNRDFIKELQSKFPDMFKAHMNDAQCNYLNYLIAGDVTYGEAGRLYMARHMRLMMLWNDEQYRLFILKERNKEQELSTLKQLVEIDSIYGKYLSVDAESNNDINRQILKLRSYLLQNREEYDRRFKRSVRRRDASWQERGNGYLVRYPQTINDFCREAVYMSNCLLSYVEAYADNDTTILFVRKEDSVNEPFITMEIFDGELMQAYHRFNKDCTPEEADWIRAYCDRHGIGTSKFHFDNTIDVLF